MSGHAANRKIIDNRTIEAAIEAVRSKLFWRLVDKGYGTFASRHELNGILDEEFEELKKASHDNKGSFASYSDELHDIAVACIFGIACINSGGLDW